MNDKKNVLGVDIGAISIGMAVLSQDNQVRNYCYQSHFGNVEQAINQMLQSIPMESITGIASCGQGAHMIRRTKSFDTQICIISAGKFFQPDVKSILTIGGETFMLIRFGFDGGYLGSRESTSCAAGTGSFLDQQARRLGLENVAQLSNLAVKNDGQRPKIASRCAVFAKTDLIHAQQEGYRIEQICDGLSYGLAKNIVDTVFGSAQTDTPILFCGGVSQNQAVRSHIESLTNTSLIVPKYASVFGAIGAALLLIKEDSLSTKDSNIINKSIFYSDYKRKTHAYPRLTLSMSEYPDFSSLSTFKFQARSDQSEAMDVETDLYEPLAGQVRAVMGIDIGSTSTKSTLMDESGKVFAGFYTRTTGRPLDAVLRIFAAIDYLAAQENISWEIIGVGTTGSGRKFIGQIIGADLILDEITAHARAATSLNPEVDTIIEIGGQDAKFTTLRNGRVTFATMNTVCAAGTGSFIEEQAKKLGCPLADYAKRTENKKAPLSSDRCTVFMERDLNYYLTEGYHIDEVLASVLHSVRENYLLKVANESRIGNIIFFQGATAKNKALVAAFEQHLQKPVLVSKFCHLTGAMGTGLFLLDENKINSPTYQSNFRGLSLYKNQIPVESEVCDYCTNHCKLSVVTINNEKIAYGFLCGRDYHTKKYVGNESNAFDLIKQRKRSFNVPEIKQDQQPPCIGIPAALHLVEDLSMWRFFFESLGFQVITSEKMKGPVEKGKILTSAEFCVPITSFHGHVDYLKDRCDFIFLPLYMEEKDRPKGTRRQYCYYTQFSTSLVQLLDNKIQQKILDPVIRYLYPGFHTRIAIYDAVKKIPGHKHNIFDVYNAYESALKFQHDALSQLKKAWDQHVEKNGNQLRVVLLGRPYTLFSSSLNCGIPGLFHKYGIDCTYQDLITPNPHVTSHIEEILQEIQWRFAANILEIAETVSHIPGLYPVLISSFKCSPDSFVQDYFKKIMASHDKPYLILELDAHGSNVGYETRIEAAIRAFSNHYQENKKEDPQTHVNWFPMHKKNLTDKILFIPHWDRLSGKLLEAVLTNEGQQVILLEETQGSIKRSLKMNTGQCIPINAIAQSFIEKVQTNFFPPQDCLLWMAKCEIACNIRLYPYHIKNLLNDYCQGMEKSTVYISDFFFVDFGIRASLNAAFAYMFSGLLRKAACKKRPYEINKGETDAVVEWSIKLLQNSFLGKIEKRKALSLISKRFNQIPITPEKRLKVAIFGDLYSRDNRVINQDLIRFIEKHGGEVVTTPYTEYAKMIANPYYRKWLNEGRFLTALTNKALQATFSKLERLYYSYFENILEEPMAAFDDSPEEILGQYAVKIEHTGESLDNLLKVHYIKKHHPDVALFVQASPALCCPALITEAMVRKIEHVTNVPVVSITYDGTGGFKNNKIIPYLRYPRSTNGQWLKQI
jgi:predicted CoA-substrate-specific enzyme activase